MGFNVLIYDGIKNAIIIQDINNGFGDLNKKYKPYIGMKINKASLVPVTINTIDIRIKIIFDKYFKMIFLSKKKNGVKIRKTALKSLGLKKQPEGAKVNRLNDFEVGKCFIVIVSFIAKINEKITEQYRIVLNISKRLFVVKN